MVTSPWHHLMHPGGLVPIWLGLRCQFRGDWSQLIPSITSGCDSNPFVCEEMQHHCSYHFFSLTTDMNSRKPKVATVQDRKPEGDVPEVRVHYSFASGYLSIPFRHPWTAAWGWCSWGARPLFFCFWLSVNSLSSPVDGNSEERWSIANVGVHSYISTKAGSTSNEFLYYSAL